jgi:hypothetical protein
MERGGWMRVLDAVGGLVELTSRFRRPVAPEESIVSSADGAPRGGAALETRLAGVLVAALKEAFDRDSARLELERAQAEAERRRAEQALQAELRRQAADQALAHLRTIAMIAVGVWALSAILGAWLPGMRATLPRLLLGIGWTSTFAALGCAFAGWKSIRGGFGADAPVSETTAAQFAPWLLMAGLAATAASLLIAL